MQWHYRYLLIMHSLQTSASGGSKVEIISVTGSKGVKLWDTRNVPNGVYLYNLAADGYSITNKMIVNH